MISAVWCNIAKELCLDALKVEFNQPSAGYFAFKKGPYPCGQGKQDRRFTFHCSSTLVGEHKCASSHIALHYLSDRVMDPLLYVVVTGLCSIRRLFYYHPTLANSMWSEIVSHTSTQGPCGALAGHLQKLHWIPLQGGYIDMPSSHQLCLPNQSTKEIRLICRHAWATFVFSQVSHRKDIISLRCGLYPNES